MQDSKPETPRHPDFDAAWEGHHKLVWFMARKCAEVLGHGRAADYAGTLTILLNKSLWRHDPSRGAKLSTYFAAFCFKYAAYDFVRQESEAMHLKINARQAGNRDDDRWTKVEYPFHRRGAGRVEYYANPAPERNDFTGLIACFRTPEEFREFLLRDLITKEREVMTLRHVEGLTLKQVGERLGFSMERARQYHERAVLKLRKRLRNVEAFAELFGDGQDSK